MVEENMTITVDEMAVLLRINRNSAYRAVKDGLIPSRRIGRRIVISRDVLRDWLNAGDDQRAA